MSRNVRFNETRGSSEVFMYSKTNEQNCIIPNVNKIQNDECCSGISYQLDNLNISLVPMPEESTESLPRRSTRITRPQGGCVNTVNVYEPNFL